jgi:hypothetical protein
VVLCECKKLYIHRNRISVSVSVKKLDMYSGFTLDLHAVYMTIDTYTHNTGLDSGVALCKMHLCFWTSCLQFLSFV